MTTDLKWHYFIGSEGNAKRYSRKGVEWFDDFEGAWKRCFENDPLKDRPFQPETKYRRPAVEG